MPGGILDYLGGVSGQMHNFYQNNPNQRALMGAAGGLLAHPYDARKGLAAATLGAQRGGLHDYDINRETRQDAIAASERVRKENERLAMHKYVQGNIPGFENAPSALAPTIAAEHVGQQLARPKSTNDIRHWQLYRKQEVAAGRTPEEFTPWLDARNQVEAGGGLSLTPGQEAVDKQFGKDYAALVAGGGVADIEKNIQQLKGARARLSSGANLSGPVQGSLPRGARTVIHPESIAVQEQIEEVVQRNLKEVLGAQFTEKEGERLIARAYNPQLEEPENRAKLDRLIGAIEKGYELKMAAVQYYEQNGTLQGYSGPPSITMRDIEAMAGLDEQPETPMSAPSEWSPIGDSGYRIREQR